MHIRQLAIFLFFAGVLTIPVGCATTDAVISKPIDPKTIKSIDIAVEGDSLTNLDISASPDDLASRIGANLKGWTFPISSDQNAAASHRLTARILPVEYGVAPPIGLSFSVGNSDPRGMGEKKANVLPILCALTTTSADKPLAEMSMGFTDNDFSYARKKHYAITADKLVDHASTVCFNLLDQIFEATPATPSVSSTQSFKPSWFPEIRIETKTIPQPALDDKAVTAEEKPVRIRTEATSKKEIIIHNQGAPIILNFGYERR